LVPSYSFHIFFIFRYYFVVHDSGMVPAKLPALLRSSLLQFCLFKTKMRIFTEFSVSFRERFTYFVYKKRRQFFFPFPTTHRMPIMDMTRNRFGRIKIYNLIEKTKKRSRSLSLQRGANATNVHKFSFGLPSRPGRVSSSSFWRREPIHNRVEK